MNSAKPNGNVEGIVKIDKYNMIQQATDIDSNIELILHTRPEMKKIYMIIGDSADEQTFYERFACKDI